MNEDPSDTPTPESNLTGLGRELLGSSRHQTGGGSQPAAAWVPPSPEELGAVLPGYDVQQMLGKGGMGAVYMGRQKSLDRPVAIKILSAALGDADVGFSERFKNEAKAMAKLNHPGIVSVYDFGEAPGGLLYIVMEYVEGTDVARMIAANGRLHTEHAMAITAHVCDALAYAHERGIIHRDIKPANIMVGYDGAVKVADFGLAKVDNPQGNTLGLTQTGVAMGTMHFMAPEMLILGSAVDQRADIYAVGVMLYQMLTGKLPHGMFEMPSRQVPGLDPRYDGIIAQAMREDRDKRYGSATDLRKDLDAILTRPVVKADPAAANQAAAVLPTNVRPKRPLANQPYRPPQSSGSVRQASKKSASLAWFWITLLLLGGVGVWGWKTFEPVSTAVPANIPGLFTSSPGPVSVTEETIKPEQATKDKPFVNSLGMKFVPVPGTNVLFCIHETRREDYAAFAVEDPGNDDSWQGQIHSNYVVADRVQEHPAWNLSWKQASAFCEWLSAKEGVTYRLPTDSEWSFAAGIGTLEDWSMTISPSQRSLIEGTFAWGSEWPPPSRFGNYSDKSRLEKANTPNSNQGYIENYEDGFPTTAPVMSFAPNELGIYDMDGNLMEWCEDTPWDEGSHRRVLRGASWVDFEKARLRLNHRNSHPHNKSFSATGFRVVLEIPGEAPPKAALPTTVDTRVPAHATSATPTNLAQATKDKPFENTLGMKFVPVPGTDVLFCIHETRWKDYAKYAGANPGVNASWRRQAFEDTASAIRHDDHPVVYVNWSDANGFCEWLSKREGKTYRLPKDREWSAAVGIAHLETWGEGTTPESVSKPTDLFPWGSEWPPPAGSGNFSDRSRELAVPNPQHQYISNFDDGFPMTAPVMSFAPNPLGIFDLGGNVIEWCNDWWNDERTKRVCRRSGWASYSRETLLSSARSPLEPLARMNAVGFRIALEIDKAADSSPTADASSAPGVAIDKSIGVEPTNRPWPSDDAHFKRVGRFLAWSSIANDPILNLEKLREVDDVEDVYLEAGEWVILRANGETVSRSGNADRNNIAKICRGYGYHFGLIDHQNKLEIVSKQIEAEDREKTEGYRFKDAFINGTSRFAIDTDGRLHAWGSLFSETDANSWAERPNLPMAARAVALSGLSDTKPSTNWMTLGLAVLLDDGSCLVWDKKGEVPLPDPLKNLRFSKLELSSEGLFLQSKTRSELLHWNLRSTDVSTIPLAESLADFTKTGPLNIFGVTDSGGLELIAPHKSGVVAFDQVLSQVKGAKPGLISLNDFGIVQGGVGGRAFRLLWFDHPERNKPVASPVVDSTNHWIDTQGRSIQAKFNRLEGTNVLLEVAGKITPVPLSRLSTASQQQVRAMQTVMPTVDTSPAVTAASPPPKPTPAPESSQFVINLSLEGNKSDEVTISLDRNTRTLLKTRPTRNAVVSCADIRDGSHTIYLHADGYAAQWIKVEITDGKPKTRHYEVKLYRLRYVVLRTAFNLAGRRELTGPDVEEQRFAFTHWTGPKFTRGTDWQIWQAGSEGSDKDMFGDTPWLDPHRYGKGFGFLKPPTAQDYVEMTQAPESGYVGQDIKAVKGLTLYFRTQGSSSEDQGYGKLLIEDVTETPPADVEVQISKF